MLYRCLPFARNIESASLLFKAMCLAGLSWQLFDISNEYFKYKVNIQTTVFIPEQLENLSMVICVPMRFAIHYQKFNRKFQHNWTPDKFLQKGMINNLSIHDIYTYTYNADDIVYVASYQTYFWTTSYSKTKLSTIMQFQKYIFARNLCYLYSFKSFKLFSINQIRGSNVGYFYFGKQISQTAGFWLFIAEKDKIPFRETIEARYIQRGNSSMKLDYFQSSHYSIRKKLLPPPHETGCFSYSKLNFTNSVACVEHCIVKKSFQKWKAISNISLIPNNAVNFKFVMERNSTKYLIELRNIRLSCQKSCPNPSCDDMKIVTTQEITAHLGMDSLYKGKISILWQRLIPSSPSIKILCRPSWTLTQLILFMMSSVSTWTGLSMMSFNPILLLRGLSKIKWTSRISHLELRRRCDVTAMDHTVRMSRFENRLLSQSLAIERLRQMLFHLLKDRKNGV